MKILTVTGLSNEQDFLTGQSFFVLILNKDIRIQISEDIAAKIVQEMYQESKSEIEEASTATEDTSEEDGIDQI